MQVYCTLCPVQCTQLCDFVSCVVIFTEILGCVIKRERRVFHIEVMESVSHKHIGDSHLHRLESFFRHGEGCVLFT